ncbi:MAG: hypothetical protein MUP98_08170 [Candidatus Aminicenantes bacterium]|nr:hypothetical protein [Candidatus Aminicenantes bacterium]
MSTYLYIILAFFLALKMQSVLDMAMFAYTISALIFVSLATKKQSPEMINKFFPEKTEHKLIIGDRPHLIKWGLSPI